MPAPLLPTSSLPRDDELFSLDRLRKEPELLASDRERIERSIQAVAVGHYPAIIDAADCLRMVRSELAEVSGRLDELQRGVPALAATCETFSNNAAAIMERSNDNKQLTSNQAVLLELLEIPALMDTCVRNAVYDEALDLHAFVERAALMHPGLPAITALLREANAVVASMLAQLLGRLRSSIALPECLRVMGYLRRMAAFSEQELRLQFLAAREEWLAGLVGELNDAEPYEYVKSLADLHRLHLFDIIMQYRAVFFDTGSVTDGPGTSNPQATGSSSDSAAVYSWAAQRIGVLMAVLEEQLPTITEGGNLAALLEHLTYCAASLSRVGLDFEGLLQPIFERCTLQLFGSSLAVALDAFNSRLEAHKWLPVPPTIYTRAARPTAGRLSQDGSTAEAASTSSSAADGNAPAARKAGETVDLAPPYAVMEHPPLAVFTNAVLAALNELRHCAMLSACRPLAELLQRTLEQAAASLAHYQHTHSLGVSEAALLRGAAHALCDVVGPHLASAFAHMYPSNPAAKLDLPALSTLLRDVTEGGG